MRFNINTGVFGTIISAVLLLSSVGRTQAQNDANQYTVYASLIYARTGEHTPAFKLSSESYRLTPYGAQQMYNMVGIARG
jgi:hypothetical protein